MIFLFILIFFIFGTLQKYKPSNINKGIEYRLLFIKPETAPVRVSPTQNDIIANNDIFIIFLSGIFSVPYNLSLIAVDETPEKPRLFPKAKAVKEIGITFFKGTFSPSFFNAKKSYNVNIK